MSRMDHIEQHALERYPQPEGFRFFRWECFPKTSAVTIYYQLTGAVAVHLYKSGPRKGRTNWKLRDKSTEKEIVITVADQLEWDKQWQERTGLCLRCGGEKKTVWKWSAKDGTEYMTCAKCKGTGQAIEEGTTQ